MYSRLTAFFCSATTILKLSCDVLPVRVSLITNTFFLVKRISKSGLSVGGVEFKVKKILRGRKADGMGRLGLAS